ncbi:MAG TPA: glycosyltransferase family 2 protein [Candidatus Polarisedimenticolia bacterium]|nr:glycosyltransferase family 2 protein [Candidatus Polarisedimenticolia bacterium]
MVEIGVVLPAFNAGRTVGAVVAGVRRYLPRVTVVDDGSTDSTREQAEAAGARVLSHPRNRGKGAALRTAFETLHSMPWDALITLDADGQHDPSDIPRFLEAFERRRPELIVGSRQMGFAGMSRSRRFGNRFSSAALAFFSGLNLPDSQSGYRLYSMLFIRSLRLRGNAYEAEMESLLQAAVLGLRVETVPVHSIVADGRIGSHYRPWLDTFRICLCVVQFSLRRHLSGRAM